MLQIFFVLFNIVCIPTPKVQTTGNSEVKSLVGPTNNRFYCTVCCRVKSGNFGHQVNSDIHLKTVKSR